MALYGSFLAVPHAALFSEADSATAGPVTTAEGVLVLNERWEALR